ncbi:DnaQ-like DNA polymerase III subunit [Mycobacterium phage Marcoliusprime]|uniref:DnaQ-like DNA polymerase III subunit n=1 Tax=Mycobacterium phage Findley TaxID=2015882 RepID=A0A222ZS37_9CAUD|nr:DNA polymerase exonuclease subunit [Mycobacterium phage Milly]YP_009951146.1 DNA polymerase exonuclease subunit [Mycobacterium phage Findley]AOZ64397.1 DnaQ-like DNA polymerase III subunit [Mycobacterium phage Marcoliusprime]ASR86603.1 DnaQ-like DNA polymerase III subunit [Mycobacterium phage DismalFunk]AYB69014.1 DnaQ-like DNA polymerase III subunit [Mycobacterium phage DismalStressor]AJA43733.1 DnaQ-like DNA polymerase III subunit [Mycobacterium phage Milly]ASR86800.1 DnaQ-like DNA polym
MTRQLVVVDCETTGLHADAAILEVAAVNIDTGAELHFVPFVTREQLAQAQPMAMQMNRYYERGIWQRRLSPDSTDAAYWKLANMLAGNTFAGSNPAFDSRLLAAAMPDGAPEWHHRLADLAAFTAGKLNLDPVELPGLDAVCERLGVTVGDRHSALADAHATATCFTILREIPAAAL